MAAGSGSSHRRGDTGPVLIEGPVPIEGPVLIEGPVFTEGPVLNRRSVLRKNASHDSGPDQVHGPDQKPPLRRPPEVTCQHAYLRSMNAGLITERNLNDTYV